MGSKRNRQRKHSRKWASQSNRIVRERNKRKQSDLETVSECNTDCDDSNSNDNFINNHDLQNREQHNNIDDFSINEENCNDSNIFENERIVQNNDTHINSDDIILQMAQRVTMERDSNDSEDQSDKSNNNFIGRRIADPLFFYKEILYIHREHGVQDQCTFLDIYCAKHYDKGLNCRLQMKCSVCDYCKWIDLNDDDEKRMSLHEGAVVGSIASGSGFSEFKQQMAAMHIPVMSDITYRKQRQNLLPLIEETAEMSMKDAIEKGKQFAIKDGNVINGIPFVTVFVDGAWLKRSYKSGKYDSLSGCAAIVGARTNQVLYVGMRNKFCSVCDYAERNNTVASKHTCYKNWNRDQSSSAMEKDIIVEGFRNSVETNGLMYKTIIGDGDSSVYKAVLDLNPYRQYGVTVEKIECTNHLLRNMCNKIVDASKGRMFNPLVRGKVSSFRNFIKNSAFKIRLHILCLINKMATENHSLENLKILQKQILNSVNHAFGDHKNCSSLGINCDKNKSKKNVVPTLKSTGMYQPISKAVYNVSCHVRSLIQKRNNNSVESFNAIVAKNVGSKRVNHGMRDSYNIRVYSAVIQHNTKSLISKVNEAAGYDKNNVATLMEKQMAKKIESTKVLRLERGRRKPRNVQNDGRDYGDSANQPDIDKDAYDILVEQHLIKLKNDQCQRLEIERKTVQQSDCEMWHQKRIELLTASNFGKICKRRPTTSCANIVQNILYPPLLNIPAFTYGIESESEAKRRLSKLLNKKIEDAGLLIDEEAEYLGCSVDGLIDDDGIVEIKNPISVANLTPLQAIKQKPLIKSIFSKTDNQKMNQNHSYYYQVQGQLHITKRNYCIFALCTKKGIKWIKVERDDTFWKEKMEGPLKDFYFNCILPEILDSRFNRNMPIREPDSVERQKIVQSKEKQVNLKRKRNDKTKNMRKKQKALHTNIDDSLNDWPQMPLTYEEVVGSQLFTEEDNNYQETNKSYDDVEEQRLVLEALQSNININQVIFIISAINSRLNDDCIQLFLQIVQENHSEYEIHPVIYFRFPHLLPEHYKNYHDKPHLQIIGGHENYEHWILIKYDNVHLQIFDSLNRQKVAELNKVELSYLHHRYPRLDWSKVYFRRVTKQPDQVMCGIYAIAFMTDIILRKDPTTIKYSLNSKVMRNHAANIIKHRSLMSFPYYQE